VVVVLGVVVVVTFTVVLVVGGGYEAVPDGALDAKASHALPSNPSMMTNVTTDARALRTRRFPIRRSFVLLSQVRPVSY
jgi:hypothetical protein